MTDEQIIDFARKVMKEKEITGRKDLSKTDCGLYGALQRRGLLEKVGFEEKRRTERSWKDMNDNEVVELARKVMEEKKVTGREELRKADSGLYSILIRREVHGKIGFEENHRSWKDLSDEEVIEFAKKLMVKKKINNKTGIKNADSRLYQVLRRRGLLDEIGCEEKRRKDRSWKDMNDEEVIEFAKKLMNENGISKKGKLKELDQGIYQVLRERGLLSRVGFEEKQRHWKDMSNEEIVEYARKMMEENGITKRKELEKADSGLYSILQRRGLFDRTFASIDQKKDNQARDAVIDALEAFAANDNNNAEDDVA